MDDDKVTIGRNTTKPDHPDGIYPIRKGGKQVGFIDYGPRIGMMVWRVNRDGQVCGFSTTIQGARKIARMQFGGNAR
jgi:hypothetical protein